MSDETTQVAAPEAAAQPVQPQIDTGKIMEEIAQRAAVMAESRAAELADQKLKARLQAVFGEPEKPKVDPELERMVRNPREFREEIERKAVEEATRSIRAETQRDRMVQSIATPILAEYPELNSPKKLAAVEAFAMQHARAGLSDAEALKKGFEEAVAEFGLKAQSERQKEATFRHVGLPSVGGAYQPSNKSTFDPAASERNFADSMMQRSLKRRGK